MRQRLGVAWRDLIRVESRHGAIEGVAEVTRPSSPATCSLPFAYWEAAANRPPARRLDPFGKIPGFKGHGSPLAAHLSGRGGAAAGGAYSPMYESHFGINGPPFQLSPDPNFYFDSQGQF